jgi:hypothetical protein
MAVGIGAHTALFSIYDRHVLNPVSCPRCARRGSIRPWRRAPTEENEKSLSMKRSTSTI